MSRRPSNTAVLLLSHHGRPCPYCGVIMRVKTDSRGRKSDDRKQADCVPTQDHITPKRIQLGSRRIVVCRRCNSDKGGLTLRDWHAQLKAVGDPRASHVKIVITHNRFDL